MYLQWHFVKFVLYVCRKPYFAMAQNKQYQNVNEKELYDDDPGQTEISRRSKCCFKIYNLWIYIHVETKSAILNFGVKL